MKTAKLMVVALLGLGLVSSVEAFRIGQGSGRGQAPVQDMQEQAPRRVQKTRKQWIKQYTALMQEAPTEQQINDAEDKGLFVRED